MKLNLLFLICLLLFSCGDENNPVSYSSSQFMGEFETEEEPNAIAFDPGNNILYVSHSRPSTGQNVRRIQKYSAEGQLSGTFFTYPNNAEDDSISYSPVDMAIDESGNVYVLLLKLRKNPDGSRTQIEDFHIRQYNKNGVLGKVFDFPEIESLYYPSALTYNDGMLCVTNGILLLKISIESTNFTTAKVPAEGIDQAYGDYLPITDMIFDAAGNIWITGQSSIDNESVGCYFAKLNTANNAQVFNSKGKTINFAANFNNPGITFDGDGNLFLSTGYCQSVEIYDSKSHFVYEFDTGAESLPFDVAVGNNNVVYVLDQLNDKVLIYKIK